MLHDSAVALLQAQQVDARAAVDTFLRLALLGRKAKTRIWYEKRLAYFLEWLGERTMIGSVMDADLLTWCSDMERKNHRWGGDSSHPETSGPLSAAYRHGMIRAVKFLFKWLALRGLITENPASALPLPRLPRTGRKGISDRDAARILERAQTGLSDGMQARDLALLSFLESTGVRVGGLIALELDDLDLTRRRAVVREKGEKERAVFYPAGTASALCIWLAVRPAVPFSQVFLGCQTGCRWGPLTDSGVRGILRRYAEACGVSKNWSPHQWRHRFGRRMAEKGVSLGLIAQMMGHEDPSITVRHYGIFAVQELQDVYDKAW